MKAKFIIASILIIGVIFLFLPVTLHKDNDLGYNDREVDLYFVPIESYFSKTMNIGFDDISGKSICALAKDREYLSIIFDVSNFKFVNSREALTKKVNTGMTAILRWNEVTPNFKTLSYEDQYLWDKDNTSNYALKTKVILKKENTENLEFFPNKITKINFVGDIMLSRHVNTQMKRKGYDYPWEKVQEIIGDADITFANLEVPISDLAPSPSSGMSFIAAEKNIPYLKAAGIDIVSVANNHSANFGNRVFKDSLKNLRTAGIEVCGGGLTANEARDSVILDNGEISFGFLCQSAVVGSLFADKDTEGVSYLGIEPWYRDENTSIANLMSDISKTKKKADICIISPHWGVEYKHVPNNSQQKFAREAVTTGADLVIGTHPHVVQSVEYYDDGFIAYSLGNFIFDQEWSQATREGIMISSYFYDKKHVTSNLIPLLISDYAQPKFINGTASNRVLEIIKNGSVNLY